MSLASEEGDNRFVGMVTACSKSVSSPAGRLLEYKFGFKRCVGRRITALDPRPKATAVDDKMRASSNLGPSYARQVLVFRRVQT